MISINLIIISTLFLILILILIILKDGFRSRSIEHGIQLDNRLLFRDFKKDIRSLNIPKFSPNSNKTKFLIVGNSGVEIYLILLIQKNEYEDFSLSIVDLEIRCLIFYLEKKKCNIGNVEVPKISHMYGLKSNLERDIKNIINADFIILSSRWTKEDIESVKDILNYKVLNEKIIIVSNFVEFNLNKPWFTIIDEKNIK